MNQLAAKTVSTQMVGKIIVPQEGETEPRLNPTNSNLVAELVQNLLIADLLGA